MTSAFLFAFLFVAIDRLPFAQVGSVLAALAFAASLPVAVMPVSMAKRYRRRARDLMLRDPDQAMRDLTRALDLAPRERTILIERARVQRLRGSHAGAAQDLRQYLESTRGEPRARVMRARLLLQYIESGAVAAAPGERPRISSGV